MDIFPHTTERAETVVDQFGRIDRQMTYFLSSRAMWRPCAFSRSAACRKKAEKTGERGDCFVKNRKNRAKSVFLLTLEKTAL